MGKVYKQELLNSCDVLVFKGKVLISVNHCSTFRKPLSCIIKTRFIGAANGVCQRAKELLGIHYS